MPDTDQTNTKPADPTPVVDIVEAEEEVVDDREASDVMSEIAAKIAESHNILIALSSDPSVDEMSAAIGISLCLDRTGKRATAIYSGSTPNALEFLRPEEVFEDSADTLQDFVIAISKDKADHLRYKLDGDYVKIFITPYKTRIAEEDLDFSYGDFNIDLVLALNVANGVDLDAALREHGRIMHDATIINITTGNPGKFGEIEWSDKESSSISEMIARLLLSMGRKLTIEEPDATALLTGIVSATDRFSNAKTTPVSLEVASELLKSGANRELISENIGDGEGKDNLFTSNNNFTFAEEKTPKEEDTSSIDISHDNDNSVDDVNKISTDDDKKEASINEESSSGTKETMPLKPSAPILEAPTELAPEKIVAPSVDFLNNPDQEGANKYGQMLEQALAEPEPQVAAPASIPTAPTAPATVSANPASSATPTVELKPEINGIPEMNFNAPGDILPPPPAPNIDTTLPVAPTAPTAPTTPAAPAATDSFQIPTAGAV